MKKALRKGRPSVMKAGSNLSKLDDGQFEWVQRQNLKDEKHKSLKIWIDKLENMHQILISQDEFEDLENGQKKKDKFELDFEKLNNDLKYIRELLAERRKTINNSHINKKSKIGLSDEPQEIQLKYKISSEIDKAEESQKTMDALFKKEIKKILKSNQQDQMAEKQQKRQQMLDKLKVQIGLLRDVFDEQTKEVQNNRNPDKSKKSSKNDSVFFQAQQPNQVEMIKVKRDEGEEDERELNAEEEKLLAMFEENDQEIDGMLDIVIEKMDNIHMQAQEIGTEITKQSKLIEKMRGKLDVSWKNLQKRDSDLKRTLNQYRDSNKFCVDIALVLTVVILMGLVISVFRSKGYL